MGDIIAFRRTTPTIYVCPAGDTWQLRVRPCPGGIPSLASFSSYDDALHRAVDLQNEHDWAIDISHRRGLDGAA